MQYRFDWHLQSLSVTSSALSVPRCTDPFQGCRGLTESSCTPAPCSCIPCTHTSIAQTPLDWQGWGRRLVQVGQVQGING